MVETTERVRPVLVFEGSAKDLESCISHDVTVMREPGEMGPEDKYPIQIPVRIAVVAACGADLYDEPLRAKAREACAKHEGDAIVHFTITPLRDSTQYLGTGYVAKLSERAPQW